MAFKRRNSPHGHQDMSAFGTIWKGEAHWLFESLFINKLLIVLNSSLALANLKALRCCADVKTGGPVVGMKCSTPFLATVAENAGVVIDGKTASKR